MYISAAARDKLATAQEAEESGDEPVEEDVEGAMEEGIWGKKKAKQPLHLSAGSSPGSI
jgi:hypothetical protein